jgi:hypothetical protein
MVYPDRTFECQCIAQNPSKINKNNKEEISISEITNLSNRTCAQICLRNFRHPFRRPDSDARTHLIRKISYVGMADDGKSRSKALKTNVIRHFWVGTDGKFRNS